MRRKERLGYRFTDHGVRRVTATSTLDNEAARRLMEQLGIRRETRSQGCLRRSGVRLDTVTYGLLVDEWRQVTDDHTINAIPMPSSQIDHAM